MGFVCAIAMMVAVFAVVWILSRWDARSAYRMLEHSQMLFEPEKTSVDALVSTNSTANSKKRPYITPLVQKRVAAKQKWVCAVL